MKEKIFTWLYRTFTFLVPGGIALYSFLLEKLIDKDVSIMAKIGVSGIFALVIMVVIAVFFYGKYLRKKISKVTDKIIVCMNNDEKIKLIAKKAKFQAKQEIFHNLCFIAPFVLVWLLMMLIEKEAVELRGIMFYVVISMAIGFGFDCVLQYVNTHKYIKKEEKEKIDELKNIE